MLVVLLAVLCAGCGGGDRDGNTDEPKPKKWRPPASENVTDLHYGVAVYLGGLDEMMKLGPKARLTLCVLRGETRWITVKRTSNPVKAGKRSRKVLDRKQLEEKLMGYGKRLREEMSVAERQRFEALVPSELYGVKMSEKNGAGNVHFNVKFDTGMKEELKAPWEAPKDVMTLDQVAELVTAKDRKTLEAVLDVLLFQVEVDPAHRDEVCKALVHLKDDETSLFGTIHRTFRRWCDESQTEHFPPLLLGGPKGSSPNTETLLKFLEYDEAKAVRFLVEDVSDEGKGVLGTIARTMPEAARKVCHRCLLDETIETRRVGIYYLGHCGTAEDIPLMVNAVKSCPEPRQLSFDAGNAFGKMKRRLPEIEIPDLNLKRK